MISLFQRPLIAGASVSADFVADSPGKILCHKHGSPERLITIARNGALGRDTVRHLAPILQDRTLLIGVDLFFWDSAQPDYGPSLRALEDLFARTGALRLPMVLGNVPAILPALQPGLLPLNDAIERLSLRHRHCHVLRLDQLWHSTLRQGGIRMDGRWHSLPELVPDGLHVSSVASEYLARAIWTLLANRFDSTSELTSQPTW